jgi:very-short-patch-repair endonuclease
MEFNNFTQVAAKIDQNFRRGLQGEDRDKRIQWVQEAMQRAESPIEKLMISAFCCWPDCRPICQHQLAGYRLDFAFTDVRLAVEIDGHAYHSSKEDRAKDNDRDRNLLALGWHTLRFTGSQIWADSLNCAGKVREVYLQSKKEPILESEPQTAYEALYPTIKRWIIYCHTHYKKNDIEPMINALHALSFVITGAIEDMFDGDEDSPIRLKMTIATGEFMNMMASWTDKYFDPELSQVIKEKEVEKYGMTIDEMCQLHRNGE